jgi:hypothetical protein
MTRTSLFSLIGSAILLVTGSAWAGNSNPVLSVSGTYTGAAVVLNSASVFIPTGILTVQYEVSPGDTAQVIAGNLVNALNMGENPAGVAGGSNMPNYFSFAAPVASPKLNAAANANGVWLIQGTNVMAGVKSFGSSRTTGKGLKGIRVGVSIDPFAGYADFEVSGVPVGDGAVTIGLDGMTATVTPSVGESDDAIMQTLDTDLATDGFSDESLNMSDAELTVGGGVNTGDPFGTSVTSGQDLGAFMEDDDSGLSTYADVVVPEPASLSLITIAGFGLLHRRNRLAR